MRFKQYFKEVRKLVMGVLEEDFRQRKTSTDKKQAVQKLQGRNKTVRFKVQQADQHVQSRRSSGELVGYKL